MRSQITLDFGRFANAVKAAEAKLTADPVAQDRTDVEAGSVDLLASILFYLARVGRRTVVESLGSPDMNVGDLRSGIGAQV
jgi:hypothetical protein